MTNHTSGNLNCESQLADVKIKLASATVDEHSLREIALGMSCLADTANEASASVVFRGADMFSSLLELAACWCGQFQDDPGLVQELIGFVNEYLPVLETAIKSPQPNDDVDDFVGLAQEQWSDYLSLLEGSELANDAWELQSEGDDSPTPAENGDEEDVPDAQISMLLSALSDSSGTSADPSKTDGFDSSDQAELVDGSLVPKTDEVAKAELANDRELVEAYLDDALRCLSSMEQAALEIEQNPTVKGPVEQFCRELHTLKGASATVGLSVLANYLHELETSLQQMFDGETKEVKAEPLFEAVDRVRDEIGPLQSVVSAAVAPPAGKGEKPLEPNGTQAEFGHFAPSDDSSIRIRAAKLDRLMDMLAELVVLRNRRESHVSEFNSFNDELARCASRLSFAEEHAEANIKTDVDMSNPFIHNHSSTFSEVAKDISVVSNGMRELQKPVSLDNAAISRFIRDFRQELMQLRRVPVSGLFNRLQRAARDAAKSENKQVQIKVVGGNAGLEQEIQERLFESLLHVVRNSVSHGIEAEDKRVSNGKSRLGTITLEASSNAQLLMINVRDDGNGLDHEAIRRRAIDKGLLSANQRPSNEELARLIFHPGFSTREQATAVSGRGVGMDIVSKTIEQLHGRVDVDSVLGEGTTVRLSIPLRSGIEHVMVFRSGGQLFALPMQSVTAAKSSNANIGEIAKLSLSSAFSQNGNHSQGAEDVLILRRATAQNSCDTNGGPATGAQIALAVDELVGHEEVVVRGLPTLLKSHPLFCGVTLSGSGEKVLLLDSERVLEFCDQYRASEDNVECDNANSVGSKSSGKISVLVVDDSLTARKGLVKILHKHGFATAEAGDGIEAIERLHKQKFDLVLTDLDMPRFGGLELLADIQSSRYCDSPVVVVSSRNEEAFRTKAMDVGASDYVTKPVSELSIAQLLEKLQLLPEIS